MLEIKHAHYTADDLVKDHFKLCELRVGFTASELKNAGCNSIQLREEGGYTASELRGLYDVEEIKDAGYNVRDMKDAGFTCIELKNAKFAALEMKLGGWKCD
jgi:intracellular multiplication protein IcmE